MVRASTEMLLKNYCSDGQKTSLLKKNTLNDELFTSINKKTLFWTQSKQNK